MSERDAAFEKWMEWNWSSIPQRDSAWCRMLWIAASEAQIEKDAKIAENHLPKNWYSMGNEIAAAIRSQDKP